MSMSPVESESGITGFTGFTDQADTAGDVFAHGPASAALAQDTFDVKYEFSAPQWYDFTKERDKGTNGSEEQEEREQKFAEKWFETDHKGRNSGETFVLSKMYVYVCV